jgi:hypothetical protein
MRSPIALIGGVLAVRTIFLPPRGGWPTLRYDNDGIEWLAREMQRQLAEALEVPYPTEIGSLAEAEAFFGLPVLCRNSGELDASFRRRMMSA